jgi:hypothetical protein
MARCPIHPSPTEGFTLRPGQGRQEVWLPWHESGRAERLRNLETAFPNADFPRSRCTSSRAATSSPTATTGSPSAANAASRSSPPRSPASTLGGSNRDRLAEQSGRDVERFR